MWRTLAWLVLTLFLTAGSLFSQPSQSGAPTTSSNKQTPDTSNSGETTRKDAGVLQGIAKAAAKSTEEKAWFDGTGKALLLWNYLSAQTPSEEDRAAFEFGISASQSLFLGDFDPFLQAGLIVAFADRVGLLPKTELEKMEDNAYLYGFVTPEPVSILNSSAGIVIDSQLVSDSSAPPNGITIDTQVLPNASNDGIEIEAPSAPISIESSPVPTEEGTPGGRQSTYVSSGRHRGFSLDNFLSDLMPWLEFGAQVAQTIDNVQSQVGTQQRAANKPNSNDPCANISHNTIVYAVGCTGKPVTPTGPSPEQLAAQQLAKEIKNPPPAQGGGVTCYQVGTGPSGLPIIQCVGNPNFPH